MVNRRGTEFSLGKVNSTEDVDPLGNAGASLLGGLVSQLSARSFSNNSKLNSKQQNSGDKENSNYLSNLIQLLLKPQLNLASIPHTLTSEV